MILTLENIRTYSITTLVVGVILLSGCGDSQHDGHDHSQDGAQQEHAAHSHEAPHGGTVIILGEEQFHLEALRDAESGTLTLYVLDGHMESFVRINMPEIKISGSTNPAQSLALEPLANLATGETEDSTAQFEANADWLKDSTSIELVINSVTVKGVVFEKVRFTLPSEAEAANTQ